MELNAAAFHETSINRFFIYSWSTNNRQIDPTIKERIAIYTDENLEQARTPGQVTHVRDSVVVPTSVPSFFHKNRHSQCGNAIDTCYFLFSPIFREKPSKNRKKKWSRALMYTEVGRCYSLANAINKFIIKSFFLFNYSKINYSTLPLTN